MLGTAVLMAASVVIGQAEVSPNYEHLKPFDALIGTWEYKGPVLEDVSSFPEKGTPMVVHMNWSWLYGDLPPNSPKHKFTRCTCDDVDEDDD